MVNFSIFELFFVVVAIFDLEHDVEAIDGLCYLLTASGNLFHVLLALKEGEKQPPHRALGQI